MRIYLLENFTEIFSYLFNSLYVFCRHQVYEVVQSWMGAAVKGEAELSFLTVLVTDHKHMKFILNMRLVVRITVGTQPFFPGNIRVSTSFYG